MIAILDFSEDSPPIKVHIEGNVVLRFELRFSAEQLDGNSLLAVDLSSALCINDELLHIDRLLPARASRFQMLPAGDVCKELHQLVHSAQTHLVTVGDLCSFDFAIQPPEQCLPTINSSAYLAISWTLTAKLLPLNRVLTRELLVQTCNSAFDMTCLSSFHLVKNAAIRGHQSPDVGPPNSLVDIVFYDFQIPTARHPDHRESGFDIKRGEAPFGTLKTSLHSSEESNRSSVKFDVTLHQDIVKRMRIMLLQVETMNPKFLKSPGRPSIRTLRTKHIDNLPHIQHFYLLFGLPGKNNVPWGRSICIGDMWKLEHGFQVVFDLVDGTTFECHLPLPCST
jgi:hypothetical protein